MKKRVFTIIGALALCLSIAATAAATDWVTQGSRNWLNDGIVSWLDKGDPNAYNRLIGAPGGADALRKVHGDVRTTVADLRLNLQREHSYEQYILAYYEMANQMTPERMRKLLVILGGNAFYALQAGKPDATLIEAVMFTAYMLGSPDYYNKDFGYVSLLLWSERMCQGRVDDFLGQILASLFQGNEKGALAAIDNIPESMVADFTRGARAVVQ